MGWIAQLFERRTDYVSGLANPEKWLVELFGGPKTTSGMHVTEEKALCLPAVWSAVNRISSTVASLPLHVYRRRETGKERAVQHPAYTLLHDASNPYMTAMQFRRTLTAHVLLWGNGYAYIERNQAGELVALWPLSPAATWPAWVKIDGQKRLVYNTVIDGQGQQLLDYEVLHVAGLGFDGLQGYSVIAMEREAVGLGLAMQDMTARVVANNAVPPVVLVHPASISEDAQRKLAEAWRKSYGGDNVGKVGVLAEGIKIEQLGMPLKDAEFLAQRNYTVLDVARMFNMPATLLEGGDKAPTYASAEQFDNWFAKHTIRPWLVAWEQAIALRLFTGLERRRYFAEHALEGILRGDSQARAEYYNKLFQIGALSINDIRELENQNGIGPEGDRHFVPLNMVAVEQAGQPPQAQRDLEPVWKDARQRILRRARNDVSREAEKRARNGDLDGLLAWIDEFCVEHVEFAERNLEPVCRAEGRPGEAEMLARNHAERLRSELKMAVLEAKAGQKDLLSALNGLFSRWSAEPEEVF
ncbi:MAG TPA: phage portal protein [Firmicutes bacterium]|nr:phage portal protein [Bacillota bacterium]